MKKRIICWMLSVLFLICSAGCSTSVDPGDTTQQGLDETYPAKDNVNQILPPKRPEFDTLAEIKAFFDVSRASDVDSTCTIKNYVEASKVADICGMADKLVFPTSGQAQLGDAIYYKEHNSLDMIFGHNGIQYRFTYYFDSDFVYENESAPALQNVQVGPYEVDFWKRDHPNPSFPYEYYGFVRVDEVYLSIISKGKDMSDFSLDIFEFVPLSSVGGDVVE